MNINTSIDDEIDILLDEFTTEPDIDDEIDILLSEAEEDNTNDEENQQQDNNQEKQQTDEETNQTDNQEEENPEEDNQNPEEDNNEDNMTQDDNNETEEQDTDNTEDNMQATEADIEENKERHYYFTIFRDMYDNVKLFVDKVTDLMETYSDEQNKILLISIQDELYNLKYDLELFLIDKIKIMPIENINIVYISVSSKVKILLDIVNKISSSETNKD